MNNLKEYIEQNTKSEIDERLVPFKDYDPVNLTLPRSVTDNRELMRRIHSFFKSLGWELYTTNHIESKTYNATREDQLWKVPIE